MAAQHVIKRRAARRADDHGVDVEHFGSVGDRLGGIVGHGPYRNNLDISPAHGLKHGFERPHSFLVGRMGCVAGEKSRPLFDIDAIESCFTPSFCAGDSLFDQPGRFVAQRQQRRRGVKRFYFDGFGERHQTFELIFNQIFRCPVGARLQALNEWNLHKQVDEPGAPHADGNKQADDRHHAAEIGRQLFFDEIDTPGDHDHGRGQNTEPKDEITPSEPPADRIQAQR